MLVSQTQITMNSSLNINSSNNPACVINNPTVANSNISFRNGANFWTTGMEGGNFLIKSNFLPSYTIPAGSNMPSMVAVQINQDAFANFAGHMNLWGTLYAKQDIWSEGTAYFRRDIRIQPTVESEQSGVLMYGGPGLTNYWYLGRGTFNVGPNNFVIGSNMISPIYNGLTQPYVGFQII